MRRFSPNGKLVYHLGGTRRYELPTNEVTLAQVFEHVDSAAKDINILDWAVSNATLEEVFIRFAKEIGAEGGS